MTPLTPEDIEALKTLERQAFGYRKEHCATSDFPAGYVVMAKIEQQQLEIANHNKHAAMIKELTK